MINITKDEAMYLEKQGFRWHDHIHSTKTRHRKYYATESQKVLNAIAEYRQGRSIY